ncbi:MAG: ABC transporter ATP-binding protein [Gemmatimonadota bacterium]
MAPSDARSPDPAPAGDILTAEGLSAGYGKKQVLHDVSLRVARGEAVAVLGHNGAGKTTLLRAVFGLLPPWDGRITFEGGPAGRASASASVRSGMAMIPSERFVFADLSVADNLRLGALTVPGGRARDARLDAAYETFPLLKERSRQLAGTMSGGQQRLLSLAMALMTEPRLLLLDEPSLGLAPALAQSVLRQVKGLVSSRGMSVILLEQNVVSALELASRVYVMRSGRIILEESAQQLQDLGPQRWWELF